LGPCVSPTNSAVTRSACAVKVSRWHAGLRTWLDPRVVRYYPSRGVNYESHLTPPPHLVGLRIAALDALLEHQDGPAPVVVVSAVALSEKVPDPSMRPRPFWLRKGDPQRAVEYLDAALASDPTDLNALTNRGEALLQLGEREAARRDLQRVAQVSVNPRESEADCVTRARALLRADASANA